MGERGDRGDEAGGPTGGVGGAGGGGGGAGGFNTAVICESCPGLVWICGEGIGLQSESGTVCAVAAATEDCCSLERLFEISNRRASDQEPPT